jgi:predicted AAA+ superfamily ATPase
MQNESNYLTMQGMKPAYEALLQSYLKLFSCVVVIGIRQCGKTKLLKTLPASWKCFDLER